MDHCKNLKRIIAELAASLTEHGQRGAGASSQPAPAQNENSAQYSEDDLTRHMFGDFQ